MTAPGEPGDISVQKGSPSMTGPTHHPPAVTVPAVASTGATAHLVRVRAARTTGQPPTTISGLPDQHAWTTLDRVRAAIVNAGLAWPPYLVALSLSPHTAPAGGDQGLDLAFAVAVLAASGQVPTGRLTATAFLGGLGLDGGLRPLPDVPARIARRSTAAACPTPWSPPRTSPRRR
jgi:magnesium chelatase family protein